MFYGDHTVISEQGGAVVFEVEAGKEFASKFPTGKAAIELFLYQMQEGGFISAHDAYVGKTLAHVLCGGDIPFGTRVSEERLLELEREAFLHLCGQQKTQERIAHFAMTGKPLRN